MNDKPKRKETYKELIEKLHDTVFTEKEKLTDGHIFIGLVMEGKDEATFYQQNDGSESVLLQMLVGLCAMKQPSMDYEKVILLVAQNILLNMRNTDADLLGGALAIFLNENYEHEKCTCPKCQKQKADKLKDINLN